MNGQELSNSQILAVDWQKEQASSLVLPKPPSLSSPKRILQEVGIGINVYQEPAHKVPESHNLQHIVVVGLSQTKIERKMDGKQKTELLVDGSTVLIPAQVNHQGTALGDATFALLFIEPKSLANHIGEVINPDHFELIPTFGKPDPLIYGIANSIKADFDSGNYDQLYIETLFHALSAHLLKHYATKKVFCENTSSGLPRYKLKQALEYINDNLDRPIKLKEIAEVVDLSHFYFSHLFKESTGMSPYQYVIQQRVIKAQELITSSKLSLADIAYECGFSSQSQMTHHFRNSVGITPRVYWLNNQ